MRMGTSQIKQRQSLSLALKENITALRIRQWYEYWDGNVYVAFSGGKDSTVLLHKIRELYPQVPAIFCDTGLEFPEIRQFVRTISNTIWIKPKMNFRVVLEKYGYPVISKEQAKYIREVQRGTTQYMEDKRRGKVLGRNGKPDGAVSKKWRYLMDQDKIMISERCCDIMKKRPFYQYEQRTNRKGYIGSMAGDSRLRSQSITRYGCNAFDMKHPQSRPLAMWLEQDIWDYIRKYNIPYSEIYKIGYERTGCAFCMFGIHMEKEPNRFQMMSWTHPKLHSYCINKLGCGKVMDLIRVPYE